MEAVIVLLAIVPAMKLEHVSGRTAGILGLVIAVMAIVLSGLVGRPRMGWVLYAGSVFQVLVIASGVFMHAMYVLGVIFALLWFTGIWLAKKWEPVDRARAAAAAGADDADETVPTASSETTAK
jgi:hypothetical protein